MIVRIDVSSALFWMLAASVVTSVTEADCSRHAQQQPEMLGRRLFCGGFEEQPAAACLLSADDFETQPLRRASTLLQGRVVQGRGDNEMLALPTGSWSVREHVTSVAREAEVSHDRICVLGRLVSQQRWEQTAVASVDTQAVRPVQQSHSQVAT